MPPRKRSAKPVLKTTKVETEPKPINQNLPSERVEASATPSIATPAEDVIPTTGRRMIYSQRQDILLEIELAYGDIAETSSSMIMLAQFQGLPPSTPVLYLDENMEGELLKWVKRRQSAHSAGELDIIPTGRHYIMAEMVAFLGLGQWSAFNRQVFRASIQSGAHCLLACHFSEFSTVLMSGNIPGGGELSLENALEDLLLGLIAALRTDPHKDVFRRIVIVENNLPRYAKIEKELGQLLSNADFLGVTATVLKSSFPSRDRSPSTRRLNAKTRVTEANKTASLYLKLEEQSQPASKKYGGERIFQLAALLRLGASGASVRVFDDRTIQFGIEEIMQIYRLVGVGTAGGIDRADDLKVASVEVAKLLAPIIRDGLREAAGHIEIVHDAEPTRIPWEVVAYGEDQTKADCFPAMKVGISRRFVSSRARRFVPEPAGKRLRLLMVVNPTDDLSGTLGEADALRDILQMSDRVEITYLPGRQATLPNLLAKLETENFDILHYAGHSAFDASNPEAAGLLLAGEEYFTAAHVLKLGRFPRVVVFNSCESARVRRRGGPMSGPVSTSEKLLPAFNMAEARKPKKKSELEKDVIEDLEDRPRGVLSVAEGFLVSGVEHFLGTFWPVGDTAAKDFSANLYDHLSRSGTFGEAVRLARIVLFEKHKADWANYIHYGDPDGIVFDATPSSLVS